MRPHLKYIFKIFLNEIKITSLCTKKYTDAQSVLNARLKMFGQYYFDPFIMKRYKTGKKVVL